MWKVYYEVGENNTPKSKDYSNLKWALRFAHRVSQQESTGWVDITNFGVDRDWYHEAVPGSNFKWHNGQMVQYQELPEWMRVEEVA